MRVSGQNNAFINPNESLATGSRITEGIQKLSAPVVTFSDGFIVGLFQDMLNADAVALPHDLIQIFNRDLNNNSLTYLKMDIIVNLFFSYICIL